MPPARAAQSGPCCSDDLGTLLQEQHPVAVYQHHGTKFAGVSGAHIARSWSGPSGLDLLREPGTWAILIFNPVPNQRVCLENAGRHPYYRDVIGPLAIEATPFWLAPPSLPLQLGTPLRFGGNSTKPPTLKLSPTRQSLESGFPNPDLGSQLGAGNRSKSSHAPNGFGCCRLMA